MTRNPPDPARVAEARRLYHGERLTRGQVAARLGVDESTVSRWLAGALRRRGRARRADVDDARIVAMRDEERLSWRQIGAGVRMSASGAQKRYEAAKAAAEAGGE